MVAWKIRVFLEVSMFPGNRVTHNTWKADKKPSKRVVELFPTQWKILRDVENLGRRSTY